MLCSFEWHVSMLGSWWVHNWGMELLIFLLFCFASCQRYFEGCNNIWDLWVSNVLWNVTC